MISSTNKVRVVHLITLLELGGAQGNTLHTVQNLNPSEFESHLWCGQGAYWDEEAIRLLGSSSRLRFVKRLVRSIHPWFDLAFLFELYFALRATKPKILHTHSSKAGILGRWAGFFARVPMIIHTYHGFGFNQRQKIWVRFLFVFLEKITARLTTKLIFVSQQNQDEAKKRNIGKPSQYVLIRSGIPIKSILQRAQETNKSQLKKTLHCHEQDNIVLTIGAFKPQKNLEAYLSVAKEVHKIRPNTKFLIIGDGSLRPQLENKIDQLGLKDVVLLLGWRQDVPEILSIADIFVMTSLWEGLPRSLVEALVLGIPAVCFKTNGIIDLLSLGGGVLIPLNDITEMAKKIIECADHKDKVSFPPILMDKIFTEFDIDVMVRQIEAVYRN